MKILRPYFDIRLIPLVAAAWWLALPNADAASASWRATATNGTFTTTTNWSTNAVPGIILPGPPDTTDDIAFFNAVSNFSTINVNTATRVVGAVRFQTGAGAYTFTGNTLWINASTGGVAGIYIESGVNTAQSFQNTVAFGGGNPYLQNDSANSTATLSFVNVTNYLRPGDSATSSNLQLRGTNTGNNTISGTISQDSSRVFHVVKSQAGTWNLSGTSSYTGSTLVNGGTLVLSGSGSINGTSGVSVDGAGAVFRYDSSTALTKTVSYGATGGTFLYNSSAKYTGDAITAGGDDILGGDGVLGNVTIASGGTLSPGELGNASAGNLTVDSLTLQAGATSQFDIVSAVSFDSITSGGAITLAGSLNLSFSSILANGSALTLFDGGSLASNFSSITAGGAYTGSFAIEEGFLRLQQGEQVLTFNHLNGVLSIHAIPEPSTTLLLTGGLMAVVLFRRRRSRS